MIDTERYKYTKIKQTYNKDSTKVVLPRWDCLRVSQDISYCRTCKITDAHHSFIQKKNLILYNYIPGNEYSVEYVKNQSSTSFEVSFRITSKKRIARKLVNKNKFNLQTTLQK